MPTSFVVKNGSKIFDRTSSGTPGPSSLTSTTTASRSASCQVRTTIVPRPCAASIACSALRVRLSSTCWSWCASANTGGRPAAKRVDDADVRDALLVGAHRQRFTHHLVDVHPGPGRVPLARERQEVPHDPGGSLRLVEDDVEAALGRGVGGALRQPLRPGEDRRERVVQLVRDAGHRLAERGELLGLQRLVVEVLRLIVDLLPLADVANEGLDAEGSLGGRRLRAGADLDPDDRSVRAPQAQQVIGGSALVPQPLEERLAGLRIDEAGDIERSDLFVGGAGRVAEDLPEVRIRGGRAIDAAAEHARVRPFGDQIEQAPEGVASRVSGGSDRVRGACGHDTPIIQGNPRPRSVAWRTTCAGLCVARRRTAGPRR